MTLTTDRLSSTSLRVTRDFAHPPRALWQALTDPGLVPRWLLGPPGWEMPVCRIDARPGGTFHYRWAPQGGGAGGFDITGSFLALEPPRLIRHVETMFLPDPGPPNTVETRLSATDHGTRMELVMTLEAAETLDAMLGHGMTDGMAQSYDRLAALPLPG
ncbi:SRPBCC domain-containing protein [Pseudoponticoccus marisrubri]|uniref:Activator of Hsp90 ATPase homologue 1/2-like C-terminal domain-containing protein n=1 Tax=Pseudoponticoccus marisrubri TaxID=1685382 RepID=A0A0W7WGX3_9RHOB|nr:SRPBCC domain-containing protein [Pseudoponticoccus marisrubri]KUF09813.1 hypothetical protein AVJ23_15300 [Pseudoponticoccus marisrubri]